jgi:hypothetical protein
MHSSRSSGIVSSDRIDILLVVEEHGDTSDLFFANSIDDNA